MLLQPNVPEAINDVDELPQVVVQGLISKVLLVLRMTRSFHNTFRGVLVVVFARVLLDSSQQVTKFHALIIFIQ